MTTLKKPVNLKVKTRKMYRGEESIDNIYENFSAIHGTYGGEIKDSNITTIQSSELPSGDVKIRSCRGSTVCLVILCVLLLTAVILLCVHIDIQSKNYTDERSQLLTNTTNLIQLNQHLKEENDELWNLTRDGWIYYRFSFYYLFNESKSWNESKINCMERGAYLMIINSTEEEDFAVKMISDLNVWIGLSQAVNNTWTWVNGRTLASEFKSRLQFYKGNGEKCVFLKKNKLWDINQCNQSMKWICEKNL
ncbi:killer cell lectin-like receptor subfamily F member 1 [Danio aesculapii]|uniref:killer cell lectin-like receptor subfamily F member 1 n=1 Tax=Danio aesculapii TaxID=1142201 RepID=UPI0024C08146|nr:killer cell lectin-like receptor subfamily F member 1 [Danio aesculapii]